MVRLTRLPEAPRMRAMAPARSAPISLPSILTSSSPGRSPACCAGDPSIGRSTFDPVLGDDLDADAGIGAHRGEADLLELLAVEIGRVRIERRDHAAQRPLRQAVIIDVVHVVALDALVNLREEARLLPRQRRAIDRARGMAGMGGLPRTTGQP